MATSDLAELLIRIRTEPQELRSAARDSRQLGQELRHVEEAAEGATEELGQMNFITRESVDRVRRHARQSTEELERMETQAEATARAVQKVATASTPGTPTAAIQAPGQPRQQRTVNRSTAERTDTAFQITSAILGGLGQNDAANLAGLVSDLANAVESIDDFQGVIKLLPNAIGSAVAAIGLPGLIGGGALIAAIGGLAALALATAKNWEEATARAREYAEALEREAEIRERTRAAIATADPGQVQAQAAELRAQQRDIQESRVGPLQERLQQIFEETLNEVRTQGLADLTNVAPEDTESTLRAFAEGLARQRFTTGGEVQEIERVLKQINEEEITPLVRQIAELTTTATEGAEQLRRLNEPLERQTRLREITRGSSTEDAEQQIQDLNDDLALMAQQITNTDAAIADARNRGQGELANQLQVQQALNQAAQDTAQADLELLEAALPLIKAREDEAAVLERQRAAAEVLTAEITGRTTDRQTSRQIVRGTTTEDAQQQIADAVEDLTLLTTQLKDAEELLKQARADGNQALEDAAQATVDSTQAQIDSTQKQRDLLQSALPLIAAREAEQQAIEDSTEAIRNRLTQIDHQISLETQLAEITRTGTVDQVDARLASLNDERTAIINNIGELEQLASTSEEAQNRLEQARNRLAQIAEESRGLIAARPDIAIREMADAAAELGQQLTDTITGLVAQRDAQLGQLASQLQQDLSGLYADLTDQAAQDQSQYEDQLEQFHNQEIQRLLEFQSQIGQITRDGLQSQRDAAADGNIRAAILAERETQDQLEDTQERKEIQDQARQDELDEIEESADEQEAARIADYNRRYSELIANNNREVQATITKYNTEINAQTQAYNAQIAQLNAALSAETTAKTTAYSIVQTAINTLATNATTAASWITTAATNIWNAINNLNSQITGGAGETVAPGLGAAAGARAGAGYTPPMMRFRTSEEGAESAVMPSGAWAIFGSPTDMISARRTRQALEAVTRGTTTQPGGAQQNISVNLGGVSITVQDAGNPAATADAIQQQLLTNTEAALRSRAAARLT